MGQEYMCEFMFMKNSSQKLYGITGICVWAPVIQQYSITANIWLSRLPVETRNTYSLLKSGSSKNRFVQS